MLRIMFATPALLLLFLHFTLFSVTLQQGALPPKALNPERLQVLKDALSWMTFKKDGKLATDQDLEPFFETLKTKYLKSKYFRTLIVAFKDGVLPRLTSQENADCVPADTSNYRDPHNNSVTYARLKKATFEHYDRKYSVKYIHFCDYRQGLVCSQKSLRCECPKGSKMGPISEGSSKRRCQMEENEICALIDLDHDPTSNYVALKKALPEMIFNLEKPLSCKMGTQCRFKSNTQHSPLCYNNKDGPWAKGHWDLDLGQECTLDLFAEKGQCVSKGDLATGYVGVLPGYTCYNFGPLKPPLPRGTGICAHDTGSFGITGHAYRDRDDWNWDPMFIGFVSPVTTPFRGDTLRDYYKNFLLNVYPRLLVKDNLNTQTDYKGGPCNVAKTEEMLDHWKLFLSLEDTPPQGQDYVATEAELQNRLQKVVNLTVDWKKKTCKIYAEYFFGPNNWFERGFRCVAVEGSPPDPDGNDGRCKRKTPGEDTTTAFAYRLRWYTNHVGSAVYGRETEDRTYRKELIRPVELECDPEMGKPPGSEGAPPTDSEDNDVLEGGYCPPDRGCYKNYGDYLDIYFGDCYWKNSSGERALFRDCQWLDESRKLGSCEERKLDEKISKELSQFSSGNGLGRGDPCDYEFEKKIRKGIRDGGNNFGGNKYRLLWQIQNTMLGVTGAGLCAQTRLLECTIKRTCECVAGTAPRKVIFEGMEYMSDYCYVTSGDCSEYTLGGTIYDAEELAKGEMDDIEYHYREKDYREDVGECEGSNWCVYVKDEYFGRCTTKNTGHTGVKPKPGCKGEYCDYEDAAGAKRKVDVILQIISIITFLVISVVG